MLEVKERERRGCGEGGRRRRRKSLYDCSGNEGEQEVEGSSGGESEEDTGVLQYECLCPPRPNLYVESNPSHTPSVGVRRWGLWEVIPS